MGNARRGRRAPTASTGALRSSGETESAGCRTTQPRSVGQRRSLEGALGGRGTPP